MSKSPRLLYPSEQEMLHAARYYELQPNGLVHYFLEKVVSTIQDLVQIPNRWPIVQDDIRRRLIGRFPYSYFIELIQQ